MSGQFLSPFFIFEEQYNDATDTRDISARLFWNQFERVLEDEKMAWFMIAHSVWSASVSLFGIRSQPNQQEQDPSDIADADEGLVIEMMWNSPEVFSSEFNADYLVAIYGPKY
jgi:hypothetical protein